MIYYLKNNGWNQEQVDANDFAVADQANTIETTFERTSIIYVFPLPNLHISSLLIFCLGSITNLQQGIPHRSLMDSQHAYIFGTFEAIL